MAQIRLRGMFHGFLGVARIMTLKWDYAVIPPERDSANSIFYIILPHTNIPTLLCSHIYYLRSLHYNGSYISLIFVMFGSLISHGRYCNARPSVCLSVRLSVTFSFRTATRKRIDVFIRNFAGTCTMSWGCAV